MGKGSGGVWTLCSLQSQLRNMMELTVSASDSAKRKEKEKVTRECDHEYDQ